MRSFIQMLLALLTLTVMIWAVWQGYLLLRQEQLGLEPGNRSVVILFAVLSIICTFMITYAIGHHGDRVFKGNQLPYRIDLYEKCMAAWQSVMDEFKEDQEVKVDLNFRELNGQLALLASAKVIRAFKDLQRAASADGLHSPAAKDIRERLLLAMREDLGEPVDYFVRKEIQHFLK
jgi:hypothetical protein